MFPSSPVKGFAILLAPALIQTGERTN